MKANGRPLARIFATAILLLGLALGSTGCDETLRETSKTAMGKKRLRSGGVYTPPAALSTPPSRAARQADTPSRAVKQPESKQRKGKAKRRKNRRRG